MNFAGRFLGPERTKTLSQAYDFAQQITSFTKSPEEALKQAGVTLENARKAQKMLDSPLGDMVVRFVGGNKEEILKGLKKAEDFLSEPSYQRFPPVEQTPTSEIDELQASLERLKM
jgi:hypothetical protein